MKSSVCRSWNMKRNARLPRHSNSLSPSFRMPRPLWVCGWPNLSASSQSANKHSIFSARGSFRNRRSTSGSIVRALAKHLPQLLGREANQFSRALESPVVSVRGLLQSGDLFMRHSVFALRVVSGFHLDLSQCDDVGPTDNPDVLAAGRSRQPTTEILSRSRNGQSLHIVNIQSVYSLVKERQVHISGTWRSEVDTERPLTANRRIPAG